MKRSHKAEDVLKENCPAFSTIIAKALTIDEAFQYPITSVSLSIATFDGDLRQSEKASLKNFLINNTSTEYAATNCVPEKASCLTGGLAVVQSVKSMDT